MKKAFSLMEVLIATVLLAVVMLSLFQTKSNNIFLIEKSKENKKQNDYINILMDTNINTNRNKNIYLDRYFNIEDDELRREFKEVKIKVKDEVLEQTQLKLDSFTFNITQSKTTYSFDKGLSKDFHRFTMDLN